MSRSSKAGGALAVAAVLLLVGPLAADATAAGDGYPRVVQVESKGAAQLELTVVVPPVLSGAALPPSAFEVIESGQRRPVSSVIRVPVRDLRVQLVLDTTVSPATLAAQQGAAREFLLALPAQAEAGVIAGGPEPEVVAEANTDRGAAVRALVALRPEPPDDAVDITPSLALALQSPGRGTNVVVAVDSRPVVSTVPYETAQAALHSRTALYSIVLRKAAAGYLGGLPELSGGRVLPLPAPGSILAAFDTVRYELRSRYRLAYPTTIAGSHKARLIVTARGVRAGTTFAVAAAPASVASRVAADDSDRTRTLIGTVLLAFALAAALAQRLVRLRSARMSTAKTASQ